MCNELVIKHLLIIRIIKLYRIYNTYTVLLPQYQALYETLQRHNNKTYIPYED